MTRPDELEQLLAPDPVSGGDLPWHRASLHDRRFPTGSRAKHRTSRAKLSYGKCGGSLDPVKPPPAGRTTARARDDGLGDGRCCWLAGVPTRGSQSDGRRTSCVVHEYGGSRETRPCLLAAVRRGDHRLGGQCFPRPGRSVGSSYRIVAAGRPGTRRSGPVHRRGAGVARTRSRRCTPRRSVLEDVGRLVLGTRWVAHGRSAGRASAGPGACAGREDPAGWTRRGARRGRGTAVDVGRSIAADADGHRAVPGGEPDLAERVRLVAREGRRRRRSRAGRHPAPWREIAAAIEPPALVVTGDQEVILHGELLAEIGRAEPAVRRARRRRRSPLRTTRPQRCLPRGRRPVAGRAGVAERRQPPATAGMMLIWVPSGVLLSRPSRKRTSSLPT